jgi:hypothetical protein
LSLLTICQQVARSIPIAVPGTVVNNSDGTAQLLLACAQDEGEALARRRPGGWAAMQTEYTFQTVAITSTGTVTAGSAVVTGIPSTTGISATTFYAFVTGLPNNTRVLSVDSSTQVTLTAAATASASGTQIVFAKSEYALPSDYERPIDGTFWDRSRYWQMRGALSPQQWQLYKSSILGSAVTVQRRYRIRNVGGTVYLSIDPPPQDNGSTLVWEYVSNAWCRSVAGTPQTSWQADSDTGILDEYLIRLGVKWRVLERLGMSYEAALNEYQEQVDKAVAHDGGTQVIDMVQMNRTALVGSYNVQDGNFPG